MLTHTLTQSRHKIRVHLVRQCPYDRLYVTQTSIHTRISNSMLRKDKHYWSILKFTVTSIHPRMGKLARFDEIVIKNFVCRSRHRTGTRESRLTLAGMFACGAHLACERLTLSRCNYVRFIQHTRTHIDILAAYPPHPLHFHLNNYVRKMCAELNPIRLQTYIYMVLQMRAKRSAQAIVYAYRKGGGLLQAAAFRSA